MDKVTFLNQTDCIAGMRDASFYVRECEIIALWIFPEVANPLFTLHQQCYMNTIGKVFIDNQEIISLPKRELREVRRKKGTGMDL